MAPSPNRLAARVQRLIARTRHRVAGVRIRLTLVATVVLAAALALAAAIMLVVLHRSLLTSADAATSARAQEIRSIVERDPLSELDGPTLTTSKDLDIIQVIDPAGRVVASSPGDRRVALVAPVAAGQRRTLDDATFSGDEPDDKYRATVLGVTTPTGEVTVVVGAAEGPIDDVLETVAVLLAAVFPVILALLAAITYFLSGRTLRSVERIRAQVAAITGGDLSRRVSEPATGDEIARLASTMNEMLDGLETAREAQLRFVGDASHELRSPLMTIVGLLDLARTTREPLDQNTIDTILLPEARRLQGMVDDLLLLARADERGIPLVLDDVDLDDIVGDEARRLTQLRTVAVDVHIEPVRVRGDRDKLTRAVRNLVDNALRYADGAVTLTMSVDRDAQTGSITVGDDGPGIPDAQRLRVLDRFVRLDADRRRDHGGSGLGLAIVDEIVRAHAGSVSVGGAESRGAQVTITLPVDGV